MKKILKIDVDCANCANKIEELISKLDNVNFVNINFMTQKMTIDIDENKFDETIKLILKKARKIESEFDIEY